MSTTVNHRGYYGSIIHDAEDNLYHGKILGIHDLVIYHGDTPEEAAQVFREDVDAYLADLEKEGVAPPKPFANFPASLPLELQVKAALYAHEHYVDIENVIETALTNFLMQAA